MIANERIISSDYGVYHHCNIASSHMLVRFRDKNNHLHGLKNSLSAETAKRVRWRLGGRPIRTSLLLGHSVFKGHGKPS